MILGKVDTGSFEFIVLAANEDDAYRSLLQGWRRHCAQAPLAQRSLMRDMLVEGEVTFTPIEVGQVLRDGEPLLVLNVEDLRT